MLLVANEFFDALPVRQFEKTRARLGRTHGRAWRADGETLRLALAPGVDALRLAAARCRGRRPGRTLAKRAAPSPPRSVRACAATAAGR